MCAVAPNNHCPLQMPRNYYDPVRHPQNLVRPKFKFSFFIEVIKVLNASLLVALVAPNLANCVA